MVFSVDCNSIVYGLFCRLYLCRPFSNRLWQNLAELGRTNETISLTHRTAGPMCLQQTWNLTWLLFLYIFHYSYVGVRIDIGAFYTFSPFLKISFNGYLIYVPWVPCYTSLVQWYNDKEVMRTSYPPCTMANTITSMFITREDRFKERGLNCTFIKNIFSTYSPIQKTWTQLKYNDNIRS